VVRRSFALALLFLLALASCKKSDASSAGAPTASASASATASSAAPAASSPPKPLGLAQDSITLIAAGSWEVIEDPDSHKKRTLLLWTVRNTTDKKLNSLSIVIYYYDQKKKQIGRKTFEKQLNIEAHRSKELPIGIPHPQEPKGVEYREAVFTKAVFGDGTVFDDPSQAPEKRAYEEPKVPEPPP
jgi:hypothetical protein